MQGISFLQILNEYLQILQLKHPLLLISGVLFALWVIYKVEIYPRFISQLRHLPGPKVWHIPLLTL